MIDLTTATRDELMAYAKDVKGMTVAANIGIDTLRAKLVGADAPVVEAVVVEPIKKIKIIINATSDESGGDDVMLGCNGRFIQIQRGEEVEVEEKYVEILRNAKKTVYRTKIDPTTKMASLVEREVLSYPFSVIG